MKTELEQIRREADAFTAMPQESWNVLVARISAAIDEAGDAASHPDTKEKKRAGWCGRVRGLHDLRQELADLRTGAWRQWPEFAQEIKTDDSDE